MADHVWVSRGSESFATAGNWSNGVVPTAAGDSFIFRGSASQVSCRLNMDRSANGPFYRIISDPDYIGQVGTPDDPLHAATQAATDKNSRVIFRGQHLHYFKGRAGDGGHDVVIDGVYDPQYYLFGELRNVCVKKGEAMSTADKIFGLVVTDGFHSNFKFLSIPSTWPLAVFMVNRGQCDWFAAHAGTVPILGHGRTRFGVTPSGNPTCILSTGSELQFYTESVFASSMNAIMDGLIDMQHSNVRVPFGSLILGQGSVVNGTPFVQVASDGAVGIPSVVEIDLRKEYP